SLSGSVWPSPDSGLRICRFQTQRASSSDSSYAKLSSPQLFGARNGIFCRRDCGPKSAVCPSGERETQRTHWKSPPLVGMFGAAPHVGRKRECMVADAVATEPSPSLHFGQMQGDFRKMQGGGRHNVAKRQ